MHPGPTLGPGVGDALNSKPLICFLSQGLGAHPKSRVAIGVANPPTPALSGGVSVVFLPSLRFTFPGQLCFSVESETLLGGGRPVVWIPSPGPSLTRLERGFWELRSMEAVLGLFL